MKTHKPQKISLLVRPFEFRRRFFLGVSAIGFLPLKEDAPLLPEVAMWKFLAGELGEDCALDAGIPKNFGEFLVSGAAFPPEGAATGVAVRARLGTVEKTLVAIGDRYWDKRQPSEPQPFTKMPIDWRHTWGGAEFPDNPLGRGIASVEHEGRQVRPLPNIEYPQARLQSENQMGTPASFGVVDLSWPQRQKLVGTHDDRWLKEDFPGFARDIDTHFFNIAPVDQQFPAALAGTEEYLLQHMHPTRPLIEGRLPGLGMRCFVARKGQDAEALEEVKTRLTTAWFFPHAERMVLIYHGSVEVSEEDAKDIAHIVVGAEAAGEIKEIEHYREAVRRRMDPEYGAIHSLCDKDFLPVGMPAADESVAEETSMIEGEGLLRKRARQRIEAKRQEARAHCIAQGMDPDACGFGPLPAEEAIPTLEQLPDYLIKKNAEIARTKIDMEARKLIKQKEVHSLYAALGIGAAAADKLHADVGRGLPKFSAKAQVASMLGRLESARATGPVAPAIEKMLGDPGALANFQKLESGVRKGYQQTAHLQQAASTISVEAAAQWRQSAERARAAGHSFAGLNLTGADFSGMDLSDVDFTGAVLESVNFEGAMLDRANFRNAVLAHANLSGASLVGACFVECNMGKAKLTGAIATGADLQGANLTEADFGKASLRQALLSGVNLQGTRLQGCDLSGAVADKLTFNETDLSGACLASASFQTCIFLKCVMVGCDFAGAQLNDSVFLGVKAAGASFVQADLSSARFVETCSLEGSDLRGARLVGTNLRGSHLMRAIFDGATLDGADLSESDATEASFHQASCINTQFVAAQLPGASFVAANLRNAALIRAHIEGTTLRGANLFSADLARIYTDSKTVLDDTLALRTRTWPRWA